MAEQSNQNEASVRSSEAQPVEQITKVPAVIEATPAKPKKKDPKKVAAGKALAKKNREAREAAARMKEGEESSSKDSETFSLSDVLKASTLVGAGFTLYHGWSAVAGELKKRFEAEAPKRPDEIGEPEAEKVQTSKTPKGIDMD